MHAVPRVPSETYVPTTKVATALSLSYSSGHRSLSRDSVDGKNTTFIATIPLPCCVALSPSSPCFRQKKTAAKHHPSYFSFLNALKKRNYHTQKTSEKRKKEKKTETHVFSPFLCFTFPIRTHHVVGIFPPTPRRLLSPPTNRNPIPTKQLANPPYQKTPRYHELYLEKLSPKSHFSSSLTFFFFVNTEVKSAKAVSVSKNKISRSGRAFFESCVACRHAGNATAGHLRFPCSPPRPDCRTRPLPGRTCGVSI